MQEARSFADRYYEVTRDLAEVLVTARRRCGLSQEEVAHMADVSVQTYAALERVGPGVGTAPNPTMVTVIRVLWALELTPHPPT
ncbi:helix-turn-helix transcriptional regulator [Microbacterium schleiferi]|uniref:helix-turn-helix transcriptional regulator n=1 Tax=Microbacterium schleiferi TaxID=69362 RepID=UPI0035C87371